MTSPAPESSTPKTKVLTEFSVRVIVHTTEADEQLHPDLVRQAIGKGIDALDLQEEVDYTLEVRRVH